MNLLPVWMARGEARHVEQRIQSISGLLPARGASRAPASPPIVIVLELIL
jgi:hypothetical protein